MSIFYIVNTRLPTEKANGYQVCQMAQAFSENGSPVTLLKPKRAISKNHLVYKNNLKEFYNLRIEPNVLEIWSIDFLYWLQKIHFKIPGGQFFANLFHSFTFVLGLIWFFQKENYKQKKTKSSNLLYIRDVNILSWLYLFLPSHYKNNIVVELHYLPETKNKIFRYIRILSKAKAVVCITHRMKEDLIQYGYATEKIIVEHDGVDLSSFQISKTTQECRELFNYPLNELIVGYVGNFHTNGQEKGVDDLIKSAALVLDKHPNTLFYFVGGPMDRVPKYESILSELSLPKENFKFFDRRPLNLVPHSMLACDILAIPLPWNSHFAYYMSPMKLFEYMSVGRCIVATDVDSLKEILVDGENSILAKHSNLDSLSQAINFAIENPKLRTQLSENAKKQVQFYTWEKRAFRILNFLKDRI
ncbi:MAG: glycosyltransferase [Pseudobdellovibrionaceae bacterium]